MEEIIGDEDGNEVSSEFLDNLNRGGLIVPTMSTVFFVHNAYNLHDQAKMCFAAFILLSYYPL